jgi:hypothetical protein
MDDEYLPHDTSAFLLAFEPLLDKYAVLLARGTARFHGASSVDAAVPLGHHHQRGVVLPVAITERGGPVTFNVAAVAGCSSVRTRSASTTWAKWCAAALEKRTVPSISLAAALALTGELPVKLLKIDARMPPRTHGGWTARGTPGACAATAACGCSPAQRGSGSDSVSPTQCSSGARGQERLCCDYYTYLS